MTLKDLEKYCIVQGARCAGKSINAETLIENRFHAGQSNAFMWIAACIQNDSFEGEKIESESKDFGKRLKDAIVTYWHGTQREFAKKIGITEQALSRYISGGRMPKAQVIIKMAMVLGVSIDYLMGGGK